MRDHMAKKKGIDRREFIKTGMVALGGGLFYLSTGQAAEAGSEAESMVKTLNIDKPFPTPKRLSDVTRSLAERGLRGEFGRSMVPAGVKIEELIDVTGLSEEMKCARAIEFIAERAPLRILPGERIVGSATFVEGPHHAVPIYGKGSVSHTTLGFDKVLRVGYKGIRKEIDERLADPSSYLDVGSGVPDVGSGVGLQNPTTAEGSGVQLQNQHLAAQGTPLQARSALDAKGVDLLQAMKLCLDAANRWHARNISHLRELIAKSTGDEKAGYERVLRNLANVPENPPTTFAEAVQSLWFAYAFQRLCGNWSGIGRIDEMLMPYLKRDLENARSGRASVPASDGGGRHGGTEGRHGGAATTTNVIDEAREDLAHFWIKGTEWIGALEGRGSGDAQHYQNIVLAGIDAEGKEVTNDVTYLALDVVEELHISDYPIAVRLNRRTPEKLLKRIAEVQRYGGGIVAVYNEEVVIAALVKFGYPIEEARRFANDGCWEAIVPGKTSFIYSPQDSLRMLQQALGLNNDVGSGVVLQNPQQVDGSGVQLQNQHDGQNQYFEDFESLYAGFAKELQAAVDSHNAGADGYCLGGAAPPVVSMLIEGCIEKGRGYWDRGPAYTVLAPHIGGIANTANSLLAIKKLVYDEKRLSLGEFIDILRSDWQGQENLRQLVLNRIETYGNDNDEADAMVKRIFDDYTRMASVVKERNGVLRPAGISTFGREIEWRGHRRATADGHHLGEILATNFSPSPGTDRKGPTAMLKSYCKMDYTNLPNIGTLELKVLPASVKGEQGVTALVGVMKSFVKLRGCFLHIDVVDTALLLDAQRHPEKYPNLAVRIAGWSARFATLDKNWQDMVIGRTQQTV